MEKKFTCSFLPDSGMAAWQGTVCPLLPFDPAEYEACAGGSMFRIIIGLCSSGFYMCIPDWNIGMEIADSDDCFRNFVLLTSAYPDLNRADAVSIVNAAAAIKHYHD